MGENQNTNKYILTDKQKRYLPVKRAIDIVLSGSAIVVLSPVLLGISVAIKLDSPGPILFKQKRVGKDKKLFTIWKFRTMQMNTPKDIPTHMLSDPDQYITKIGKFLRKTSLDELPQIFQIFGGQMAICGPRPALWNQDDLIEERDKYGANNVSPGLTGWAQINGRDELEIPIKAKFDGDYIKEFGFRMDLRCFLGTIGAVLAHDGVVEGGTGEMHKEGINSENHEDAIVNPDKIKKEIRIGAVVVGTVGLIGIGILRSVINLFIKKREIQKTEKKSGILKNLLAITILSESIAIIYTNIKRQIQYTDRTIRNNSYKEFDRERDIEEVSRSSSSSKKILITGANSYIGMSVDAWLGKEPNKYQVDTIDMVRDTWKDTDFSTYDVVFHVAGIAHADVGNVTEERKQLYYKINTDLAVEVAEKAKKAGVNQFIFMSSMIVYSGCKESFITLSTKPKPLNFYGDSKWQADQKIRELSDENFKVVVLRPPMIYGKGSKGNYPKLAKLAAQFPIFPIVKNKRSMLHIDNLCQFVKLMIDNEESGVFFPQNREYTNTSDMVQMIANIKRHKIIMIPGTNIAIRMISRIPGKIGEFVTKAFGDSVYDMDMSEYKEDYRVRTLIESIELTER